MARIRNLPKSRSSVYLTRARQHERQLLRAIQHEDWETVGLIAVHLAIASVDAVTCAKLGQVWSGEDHAGAATLLRGVRAEGVEKAAKQVAAILEAKTRVEYGAELTSAVASSEMAKQSRRVYEWATRLLAD